MNALFLIGPIIAQLIAAALIPILRKFAFSVGLTDRPNHRKIHQNPIPLVGGISIFLACSYVLILMLPLQKELFEFKSLFISAFVILLMGILDDRYDMRASLKLAIQLIIAHYIFSQGIKIESFYGMFGIYELSPSFQYLLTILVIAGVVNAFNLMDGVDGLAASLATYGMIVFTVLSIILEKLTMTLIFLTLIGTILTFLSFNFSNQKKVFMGDAGSLMLGLVLVVFGIKLLQTSHSTNHHSITILGVISVLIIPVLDALRVFRKRIKSGRSPFSADKTHLHHLILAFGINHKIATIAIVGLVATIMTIGAISYSIVGLTFSVVLMLVVFYLATSLLQFHDQMTYWKKRILKLENEFVL